MVPWILKIFKCLLLTWLLSLFSCGLPNYIVLEKPGLIKLADGENSFCKFTTVSDSNANGYRVYYKIFGDSEAEKLLINELETLFSQNTSQLGEQLLEDQGFYPLRQFTGNPEKPDDVSDPLNYNYLVDYDDDGGTIVRLDFNLGPEPIAEFSTTNKTIIARSNKTLFSDLVPLEESNFTGSSTPEDLAALYIRYRGYNASPVSISKLKLAVAVYTTGLDPTVSPLNSLPVFLGTVYIQNAGN